MESLGHKTAVRKAATCAMQWLNILESVIFFLTVFIELKTSFGKCDDYYTFFGLSVSCNSKTP